MGAVIAVSSAYMASLMLQVGSMGMSLIIKMNRIGTNAEP